MNGFAQVIRGGRTVPKIRTFGSSEQLSSGRHRGIPRSLKFPLVKQSTFPIIQDFPLVEEGELAVSLEGQNSFEAPMEHFSILRPPCIVMSSN